MDNAAEIKNLIKKKVANESVLEFWKELKEHDLKNHGKPSQKHLNWRYEETK